MAIGDPNCYPRKMPQYANASNLIAEILLEGILERLCGRTGKARIIQIRPEISSSAYLRTERYQLETHFPPFRDQQYREAPFWNVYGRVLSLRKCGVTGKPNNAIHGHDETSQNAALVAVEPKSCSTKCIPEKTLIATKSFSMINGEISLSVR